MTRRMEDSKTTFDTGQKDKKVIEHEEIKDSGVKKVSMMYDDINAYIFNTSYNYD